MRHMFEDDRHAWLVNSSKLFKQASLIRSGSHVLYAAYRRKPSGLVKSSPGQVIPVSLPSTRSHNLGSIKTIVSLSAVSDSTLSIVKGRVSISVDLHNAIGMLVVSKALQ